MHPGMLDKSGIAVADYKCAGDVSPHLRSDSVGPHLFSLKKGPYPRSPGRALSHASTYYLTQHQVSPDAPSGVRGHPVPPHTTPHLPCPPGAP